MLQNGEMSESEYRRSAHAVFDIKYHVVWNTKHRYRVLKVRVSERVRDLIRQVCEARDVKIEERGGIAGSHPPAVIGFDGNGANEVGSSRQVGRRDGCQRSFRS